MLIFTDEDANIIVAGLNLLVKEAGLANPALYQAAHSIMIRLQEAAAEAAEIAAANEETNEIAAEQDP